MRLPKISIVMPVYNSGEWLKLAITSVQNQSLEDFELLIIDDGSTDQSEFVIAEAARNDSRIRAVHQDHLGIATALNRGIAMARCHFLARMDADDVAHPERLQRQLEFLEKCSEVAALGTWAHVIDEKGSRIADLRPEVKPSALKKLLVKQNPFIHSSMVLSKDLVKSLGGYRAVLNGAEDYDLWLRISERAQLANLPEFLQNYRRHLPFTNAAAGNKQLLAARLARMSAAERRASRPDFVEVLDAPISVAALGNREVLRATFDLYGLLSKAPAAATIDARELQSLGRAKTNHAERKAIQIWLAEVLKNNQRWPVRIRALFWLLYLHPPRGVSLIWSLFWAR
jgi:hypothetical protein